MRVLLISANREDINMPTLPMGLGCVAAAVQRAGHAVEFLDLLTADDFQPVLRKKIAAFDPKVIGVSVRNIDDQVMESTHFMLDQAREVIEFCRQLSQAPIVLGGAGYSIFPQSALEYLGADMGIQGEGEIAFPVLLSHIEEKRDLSNVPGLFLPGRGQQAKRRFVKNLDTLALPEPSLMTSADRPNQPYWLPFQTRRGCPLNCSYCSTSSIEGHLIRKRSPEAAVQELAGWVNAGFSQIFFVDNTFNLPQSYAIELCRQLTESGLKLRWRCIVYPGRVSRPLVDVMARAGCTEVSLGFESGHHMILRDMNKRFDPNDIRRASDMFADAGIRRMGFLLLGGPGETRETVAQSFDFVESLALDALKITVGIRIYPYTKLAGIAVEEGRLAADDNLLLPRFYCVTELEEWLRKTVTERSENHPNWFI
ncbi:MAG: radical SAM protein [Desulfobacterales bacterium]|nr:MAG: radical SAM protein [Desulfobacterales bacterium]